MRGTRSKSRTADRRGTFSRRFLRAARWTLRALAVCLALQMSGLVHFALDMWLDAEAAAHHFSEQDEDGHDCPPGCISCHCAHGSSSLPVPLEGTLTLLPAYELAWAPFDAGVPPSTAPPSVFRPPRA